jgi:membrane protease YdiL (CAAX protease family)
MLPGPAVSGDSSALRIDSPSQWMRLVGGVALVFALFDGSARALGSDRGQAGVLVGLLVVGVTLVVERTLFGQGLASATRSLGLGRPRVGGLAAVGATCLALVLVVPIYGRLTGASWTFVPGWLWLLPGLFAQGGVAEEVLFRGFLFGRVRRGRSFWRATGLSMLPFVGVHLLLFATMPWPIALAALLLSVVLSIPFAHLYELGGATIWAPAILHFVVQGTIKVITFAGDDASSFPLVWMVASALLSMGVLMVPRPDLSYPQAQRSSMSSR